MALTAKVFPEFQQNALSKGSNLSSDSLKVALFSAYTYSASHATMTAVKAAGTEATGAGYTAGGQALTSVTLGTSGNVTTLGASNPAWASSTITASFAVFYDAAGGTDATNIPVCYWDFGGPQSSSSGAFTLAVNVSGLLTATSS